MINRRNFLKASLGVAAGGAAFFSATRKAYGQLPMFPPSPPMEPFVDPLPLPSVVQPVGFTTVNGESVPHYEVSMRAAMQTLHRDLPETPVWGYNGTYPGPTIEARRGHPISVKWVNDLPEEHIFRAAIDPTLYGSEPGTPEVRTVVHLHGGRVLPGDDGHPEAWFTKEFAEKGSHFPGETYYYPNDQPPAMLWYHDHALAITRLNVASGLAGLYFLREDHESSLHLPAGRYEIPLVLQDKRFNEDGSIFYPTFGIVPNVHPNWFPDYLGDVGMVNGAVWPVLEVEARKYRFRMLNAANTAFFNLRLEAGEELVPFHQIGADLGFLPAPVTLQSLLMTPAERMDVIVDFSGMEGQEIIMTNDAVAFFPIGPPPPIGGPAQLMKFRVVAATGADNSEIPSSLPTDPVLAPDQAVHTRDIVMTEEVEQVGDLFLPTVLLLENQHFEAPATTKPRANSTEIWRFINATVVAHPQHIHLAHQQVLDRQPFDVEEYMRTGQIVFTGPAVPPAPNEVNAPKDTIRVDLGTVTRVLAKFEMPTGTELTPGTTFAYVHHCHMLEHEDNDMMRPFEVVVEEEPPPAGPTAAITPASLTTVQREIVLDGSASIGEGLKYAWRSFGPKQASILPRTLDTPRVTVQFQSGRGEYAFELKVTDAGGQTNATTAVINYQGAI
ncbi:MAG: multicopper oxidase domain-containing protein [Bryobacteraceae bacterium]|nr:multicopper oxidase domain-containing protein [Bryobacteraceae bacterium]